MSKVLEDLVVVYPALRSWFDKFQHLVENQSTIQKVLREYTDTNVNEALVTIMRKGGYDSMIDDIDRVFDITPSLPQETTVYRGIPRIMNVSIGDPISSPAFLSTTLDKDVAEFFRFGSTGYTNISQLKSPKHPSDPTEYRTSGEPGTLLVIKLPKHLSVIPIALLQLEDQIAEYEVLLPRGMILTVTSQQSYIIECEPRPVYEI